MAVRGRTDDRLVVNPRRHPADSMTNDWEPL